MKKLLAVYFIALAGAALFMGLAVESAELAKQIFSAIVITGFGFFVTIGHRLLAEWLVDQWDSKFGRGPND
jgi:hypothetical protein